MDAVFRVATLRSTSDIRYWLKGRGGGGEEGEVAVSASLAVFSSGSVFPKRATWTLETGWVVLVRPSSV
ncbi:hypothetical protein CCM_00242 [Cordyceps militaris CM01]|uniref:Uncharacterized protein n=1 Tax=Cordyceps militaris (strain CM01) TaxID=983644 RepID=G3J305_CORMM|nr:uncharacterized protein CCM_00242 [Cordyceps militaris CM01]EGX95588.1 hypothetical protein CCM_00242 [Cordyceps militaris CM01]